MPMIPSIAQTFQPKTHFHTLRPIVVDDSLLGETHRFAALICLCGFFLRLLLSDAVLMAVSRIETVDETASLGDKIHPGTWLICLSYFILLLDRKEPIRQLIRTFRDCKAFSCLLLFNTMVFCYWAIRGPSGVGMMLETHIAAPICAIVLSYAPRSYCRRAVYAFIAIMAVNSLMGIAEAVGKFRFFTFPAEWVVLKEHLFRASAYMGHPLINAMFTSLALYITLAARIRVFSKTVLVVILLISLVAFGGRSALVLSVAGLIPLGCIGIKQTLSGKNVTLLKLILLTFAVLIVPLLVIGGLYVLINSDLGERIGSMSSFKDESASARWMVLHCFDYLSWHELLFGVSTSRMLDIVYRISLSYPMVDIENPWMLMLMYMGLILFPVWVALFAWFSVKLAQGGPMALKIYVIVYFLIASTSNSFGRRDFVLAAMIGSIICAKSAWRAVPQK